MEKLNLNLEKLKNDILFHLKSVERTGMDRLITYLVDKTDFFTAPASTRHHLAFDGGLALHSLNVYNQLDHKIKYFQSSYEKFKDYNIKYDTVVICGLLHDICKVKSYIKVIKPSKDKNNKWHDKEVLEKSYDWFPIGHGEKSVMMLQNFIRLENIEILAIRWHMGPYTSGALESNSEMLKYFNKAKDYFLVSALNLADTECAHILENDNLML